MTRYSGNLNFTKPLTVVRSGTNQLQLTGNATVSTTGTVTFSQVEFAGSLSTATNSTIVLHRVICSGQVTLSGGANCQAFDSQLLGLTATGGKVTVKRSSFSGNLSLNNTAVEALRMTNGGVVTATARVGSGTRFVAAQSSMQNGLLDLDDQAHLHEA